MSWKCALCGKSVYFAERKQAEGKDWHNICFNRYYKKKREEESKSLYGPISSTSTSSKSQVSQNKTCPDCGTEVTCDVRFCTSCGYKFE
ncbi:Zinc-ribbon domain-containing protein [Entamoeba marina]